MTPLRAIIGAAIGGLVAFWLSIPLAVQVLLLLMAIDLATGLAVAVLTGALDSRIGRRGVTRKFLILAAVLTAAAVESLVAVPVAEGVAGFYAAMELVSILENLVAAGVPVPEALKHALARYDRNEAPPGGVA